MRKILILISLVYIVHAGNTKLLKCIPFQKDMAPKKKQEKITIFNSKELKEEAFGIFKMDTHIKVISIRNTKEDREAISNILVSKEKFIYKETYFDTRKEPDGTSSKIEIMIYIRSGTNPKFPERFTLQKSIKDNKVHYYARHLRLVGEADLSIIHSECKNFD